MEKRELTPEEIEKLGKIIAKVWIDMERKAVAEMLDDFATPFWIKWLRKLKKRKNENL